MKYEKPILFSGEMVKTILDGRKTQTRRVVKPQLSDHYWKALGGYELKMDVQKNKYDNRCWIKYQHTIPQNSEHPEYIDCPYGCGELWVRETFAIESNLGIEGSNIYKPPFSDDRPINWCHSETFGDYWEQCHYRATDGEPELFYEDEENSDPQVHWKPSIHMPRWASRIQLRIIDIRAERVQDITPEDAAAEGVPCTELKLSYQKDLCVGQFADLWDKINQKRGYGWDVDPWVWVIVFERIKQ